MTTNEDPRVEAAIRTIREFANYLGVPANMLARVLKADMLGGPSDILVRGPLVPANLDADGREVEP